jgi:hypothetical protein
MAGTPTEGWEAQLLKRRLMVDRPRFDRIKKKHGGYASWAVWANATDKPKSNIGDMRVLDPDQSPTLLQILRNDVIMLGLNVSGRLLPEPLRNFHDPSPVGQDYKRPSAPSEAKPICCARKPREAP